MVSSKSIADALKRRRAELHLSAEEVVAALSEAGYSVSKKTLYGWENDVSSPNVRIFLKLCEIYQIEDIMNFFIDINDNK